MSFLKAGKFYLNCVSQRVEEVEQVGGVGTVVERELGEEGVLALTAAESHPG